MGADVLSCTFLTALAHSPGVEVALVVSQPDKKRGRKHEISPGPVKELALMHGMKILTPPVINAPEFVGELAGIAPDIIVVMAYGQFLGKTILNMPRLGCVNLHMSLLPKYRGAAPIQYALKNGDEETGITAMMMAPKMDAGDILGATRIKIESDDTAASLGLKLACRGSDLMLDVIRKLDDGVCPRVPQDESLVTFAHKIDETSPFAASDTHITPAIDWSRPAEEIERLIRALNPKPGCHTYLPGKDSKNPYMPGLRLKILAAETIKNSAQTPPGTVLSMRDGPEIATGAGVLLLKKVRVEGKSDIDGKSFSNGYATKLAVGDTMLSGL